MSEPIATFIHFIFCCNVEKQHYSSRQSRPPNSPFNWLTSFHPERLHHFLSLSCLRSVQHRRWRGDISLVPFKAPVRTTSKSSSACLAVGSLSFIARFVFLVKRGKKKNKTPGHVLTNKCVVGKPKSPSVKFERASLVSDIPGDFSSEKQHVSVPQTGNSSKHYRG